MSPCRDGEIGRRSGLKIRRGESSVGVRFPLPAPSATHSGGDSRDSLCGLGVEDLADSTRSADDRLTSYSHATLGEFSTQGLPGGRRKLKLSKSGRGTLSHTAGRYPANQ